MRARIHRVWSNFLTTVFRHELSLTAAVSRLPGRMIEPTFAAALVASAGFSEALSPARISTTETAVPLTAIALAADMEQPGARCPSAPRDAKRR